MKILKATKEDILEKGALQSPCFQPLCYSTLLRHLGNVENVSPPLAAQCALSVVRAFMVALTVIIVLGQPAGREIKRAGSHRPPLINSFPLSFSTEGRASLFVHRGLHGRHHCLEKSGLEDTPSLSCS